MVTAVSGSLLPALLPGSPAATKLAQQNAVLPTPLQSPEEQAKQRSSALLRFDRPQVAQSTFSDLQDSALRNYASPEQTGNAASAAAGNATSAADSASRAAQAYQAVQQSLRPLQELATPPRPVPNPAALAPGAADERAADERDREQTRRVSERDKDRDTERNGRGDPARETQSDRGSGNERTAGLPASGNSVRNTVSSAPSAPAISLGAQVDLGA